MDVSGVDVYIILLLWGSAWVTPNHSICVWRCIGWLPTLYWHYSEKGYFCFYVCHSCISMFYYMSSIHKIQFLSSMNNNSLFPFRGYCCNISSLCYIYFSKQFGPSLIIKVHSIICSQWSKVPCTVKSTLFIYPFTL